MNEYNYPTNYEVNKLVQSWFNPADGKSIEPLLNKTFDELGFTEEYIEKQINYCKQREESSKVKVIKDNIWGMITLNPDSYMLIDNPIIQRLRKVKQLGFTYLVYPSAEHTRFAHSLGVYQVVTKFIGSINRKIKGYTFNKKITIEEIKPEQVKYLQHAAIFHDIGHLPFSHVCESIVEANSKNFSCGPITIERFKAPVSSFLFKDLKVAECLSLAMILSPRFRYYYEQCINKNDKQAIYRIANLVAGNSIIENEYELPNMIASGLDVDKIDYLCRDAAACGIPLGIDSSRLFLNSSIVKVPSDMEIGSAPRKINTIFVVNSSGIDSFDEIILGRAILYLRIYYHKFTRNAECLLEKGFQKLFLQKVGEERSPLTDILHLLSLNDHSVITGLLQDTRSACIAKKINLREMPKRACAIGKMTITELFPLTSIFPHSIPDDELGHKRKEITGNCFEKFRQNNLTGEKLISLENIIKEEAIALRKLAIQNGVPETYLPGEDKPSIVTISPIPKLEMNNPKMCHVIEHDGIVEHSADRSTSAGLSDAAELSKEIGYVFTDYEWRELVYIATLNVFYKYQYNVDKENKRPVFNRTNLTINMNKQILYKLSRSIISLEKNSKICKLNENIIKSIINDLAENTNYFNSNNLVPLNANVNLFLRIEAIVDKFNQFRGQGDWKVTEESCINFIRQFPASLRSNIVDLLEEIIFINRNEIKIDILHAINTINKNDDNGKTCYLVPLSPNSGQITRYLLEQEAQSILSKNIKICKSIREALGDAEEDDTIIFIDDNLSSGSQAQCQFLAWKGIDRVEWPVDLRNEQGIDNVPLSKNQKKILKKTKAGIAVCASSKKSKEIANKLLIQTLEIKNSLGLEYTKEISVNEDYGIKKTLIEFLSDVGKEVLMHCRWYSEKNSEIPEDIKKRCENDALGYSGMKGLVVTSYSVPSSTITCLWCPGIYKYDPWMPLFIRRGYLDKVVLA